MRLQLQGRLKFVFTVHGYGHGIGMSQYGANVMAKDGADYPRFSRTTILYRLVAH